ncbi:ABC transporter permease [Naasia lichenicola]|uniref:ABC transporter permease n=1 Tax=Naasia lichenicola TaxID=2565933 RepID=A0A4S4FS51_9MICO|nr:ABC transporter permease [Naasia lichenicola]THG33121.1 ABC transporter permease [Naasia lichenicola]
MTATIDAPATATAVTGTETEPKGHRRKVDVGTLLLTIWGVLGFLFLFFPVLVIIAYSFNTGRILQAWDGFGFSSYAAALSNPAIISGVQVSLYVAFWSAVVSAVLGSLAGVALARSPKAKWVGVLTGLLALTLVTPEIVNAVSLLPWFVTLGTDWGLSAFNLGLVRLIIAHTLFSCAVVTFIVRARMAGLSVSLEEAAADLGAPPIRRFLDITFPLMRPAVISGALLSFTLSLDNTVLSSFVSVAGSTPWPVFVFSSLRSSLRPEIAAMSTLMLLLTLVALGLVAFVLSRASKKTGEGPSLASTLAGG